MKTIYDQLYFSNEAAFSDAIYHIREAIKAVHKVKVGEDQDKAFMQCYQVTVVLERQHHLLQKAQAVISPLASTCAEMQERNEAMLKLSGKEGQTVYSK